VDHQSQRRDKKHRRTDAAEDAEKQQLPVSLGERARCTKRPLIGAKHSRLTEKTVIKKATAVMLTPKVRAKDGITGDTTP
jgi:hypothetical protein